jgi:hypothetical protein
MRGRIAEEDGMAEQNDAEKSPLSPDAEKIREGLFRLLGPAVLPLVDATEYLLAHTTLTSSDEHELERIRASLEELRERIART